MSDKKNAAVFLGPNQRYQLVGKQLGKGSFGTIQAALDRHTDTVVAIKFVNCTVSDFDGNIPQTNVGHIGIHFTVIREIKIMNELDSEFVVKINDIFTFESSICLVMDQMRSDLAKFSKFYKRHIPENVVKRIILDILEGLKAIHGASFCHRDLSTGNIFIDKEGRCRVGDFGLARSINSPQVDLSPTVVTIWYRPPELLFGARFYSSGVDMWSVGCILGELLTAQALFQGAGEIDQLGRIFGALGTPEQNDWKGAERLPNYIAFPATEPKALATVFPQIRAQALNFLEGLLKLNPSKRLTVSQALSHKWFTEAPLPANHAQILQMSDTVKNNE